jgi:hypothetical protein
MKKFLNLFAVVGVIIGLLTGCTSIQSLSPAQIAAVSVVISQTAETGAAYAIQQDKNNAKYFVLAVSTIDTFVLGNDLSPAAFQAALNNVTGATNQWVNLAISGAVVAYDLALSQYVSGQFTNTPAAVPWISAVESGFKQAVASTGTGLKATRPEVPYFIKDGKVDRDAIKAKLTEK